ncbi:MAG: hypothetical protein H5T69_21235, partial [Chloroflexi bacterium]|nr:hypothetical protein [Chloroflexota bacterium]
PIPVKLTNNMVTRNQAATAGSGLWFGGGVGNATLKHNTIADNSAGVGQGMWVAKDYAVTGTNTIFAGHSAGVYADQDARVTLDKSLWHNNAKQSDGPGTVTKTNNLSGDPKFVNSAAGDYHIGPGSAALDRAVNANVTDDIDLQQRPQDSGYDIGADEYVYVPPPPTPTRTHLYLPLNIKD